MSAAHAHPPTTTTAPATAGHHKPPVWVLGIFMIPFLLVLWFTWDNEGNKPADGIAVAQNAAPVAAPTTSDPPKHRPGTMTRYTTPKVLHIYGELNIRSINKLWVEYDGKKHAYDPTVECQQWPRPVSWAPVRVVVTGVDVEEANFDVYELRPGEGRCGK